MSPNEILLRRQSDMANTATDTKVDSEDRFDVEPSGDIVKEIGTDYEFKREIVWKNVIIQLILHVWGIYGLKLIPQAKIQTILLGNNLFHLIYYAFENKSGKWN